MGKMRTLRKSLFLFSTPIRCSTSQKLYSSCSSSLSYLDNLDSHNPLSESNPKSAILYQFPEADDVEHTNTRFPISQNYQNPAFFPQSDVLNVLLSLKHEPLSALDYFKMVEKQPGFNAGVDCYCVLIHILAGHKVQRKLVNQWTSNHQFPDAGIVIDCLASTADRFRLDFHSRVFNYLLNGFVLARKIQDAMVCLNWMIEKNVDLWVSYVNLLFNALIKKNMVMEVRELYGKMNSRGIFGDSATVLFMMRACLKDGRRGEAEQGFRRARDRGIQLDAGVYSCAIEAVSEIPDSNAAYELLMEMRNKGWVPSGDTFTKVIIACVKNGNLTGALMLKDEVISHGMSINLGTAMNFMKGSRASGDLENALNFFTSVNKNQLSVDKGTYSVLIGECCKKGNVEKASELYDQMIGMGIKPSVHVVNLLIKEFLNSQRWEKAYEKFNTAVESGAANVISYNLVLSWLCAKGQVNEAQQVWNKMVKTGITPTVASYNLLIRCYSSKGNVVAADSMYMEMMENGIKPNAVTFTNLMDGYFKKGETEKALKLLEEMVNQRIAHKDHAYNIVICGLCKCGQTAEAMKMLESFTYEGGFRPSCFTYNSIIDGYVKEGALDLALSVHHQMREKGISSNVVTFTILIDGFCKSNNIDLALKVRNVVISKGIELDVTAYGALIHAFCKRRDMESACILFAELLEKGLSPNEFIYNSMISGYKSLNNMEAALRLHKEMIEQGIPCDLETYTNLIDGLVREGKLLTASDFYARMLSEEIEPDVITYTVLVKGFCGNGQLEKANGFLKEMDEKGLPPNSVIYEALIMGHMEKGNLCEASRLHDKMLKRGLVPHQMTLSCLMGAGLSTSKDTPETAFA